MPDANTAKDSLSRRLVRLAAPVVAMNVLHVLALAIDTAMCGWLPEPEATIALTALGFSTQVIFLLMVGVIGLSVGAVAMVARVYGAGQPDRVNYLITQATQGTVLLSLLVALLGNLIAEPMLIVLGAGEQTLGPALAYLRPQLTLAVFFYVFVLLSGVLRGVGNTRLALEAALVNNGLNVVFNYGLILGNFGLPSLGVEGAAYGTVSAQLLGVSFLLWRLHRGALPGILAPLRPAGLDRNDLGELWRVGWPAALDMIILNIGFMAVVGMVGHWDEEAVAAHGIGLRMQGLAFVPGLAISRAAGAMIGNALGADDVDEARSLVLLSLKFCGGVMASLGLAIVLLSPMLPRIFGVEAGSPVGDYAVRWMQILGLGMPLMGIWIAFAGMLQGAGRTKASLRINGSATLLIQLPVCAFLGYGLGLGPTGVWLGFPVSFLAKAWMGARVYRRGSWAEPGERVAGLD